jgi:hypothetical protein
VPEFRVDTGAMYNMISAEWARRHYIPMPDVTSRLSMRTASGLQSITVRDGELLVRFPQLPNRVLRLYCLFSENYDPTNPPLLGLNNFFDLFRVTFTGHYIPQAPFGHMFLETD